MSNSGPGKALIVDDEKTNRLILRSLLNKQGYETIEAVNGREAIETAYLGRLLVGLGVAGRRRR